MSKRSTISPEFQTQLDESPIDILVNGSPAVATKAEKTAMPIRKKAIRADPQDKTQTADILAAIKERMTVQISKATIERVKDVVYWDRMTVAQFVEESLEAAVQKLEKLRGEAYPKRKAELKPGRPLK